MSKVGRARSLVQVARRLARLSADEVDGLLQLARVVADENVAPRRAGTIDPTAWISPLASIRFADRVRIGAKASVGPHCCIWGGWSQAVAAVGDGALLSPGVVLVAGNHRIHGPGAVRDLGFDEADVTVGAGAWIGAHAVIVGCTVGEGAVVGANATVLDDVPPWSIAAGSPARVVGQRRLGAAP